MPTWYERAKFAAHNPKDALNRLILRASTALPAVRPAVRLFADEQTRLFLDVESHLDARRFADAAKAYRAAIAADPERSTVYEVGQRLAQDESQSLESGFYSALIDQLRTPELRAMFIHIAKAPALFQPSRLWLYFMTYNALQIETGRIENFKRSVNKNYFNWTADRDVAEQFKAVKGTLDAADKLLSGKDLYHKYLRLLYDFTKERDNLNLLRDLKEPEIGNPIFFEHNGVRISADMCNTTLELNTVISTAGLTRNSDFTLYELGSGCGRIGYGLLACFPNARYVAIDIPAALYVAQWYLSNLFPDTPVFRFRDFSDYRDIKPELERSRIAFLTPDQAGMLPPKSCDIFMNICSLQEMSRKHVDYWFGDVDRLCRGIFYYKQSKEHYNIMDEFSLDKKDYPVKESWRTLLDRTCPTFPMLFELIYRI
jgi:putative sugar O-methyltransferase